MLLAALLLACLPLLGCGYISQAVVGQLDIICNSVDREDALARGVVDEQGARQLRLIEGVLAFARDELGLTVNSNYTVVYDTAGDAPSWVVAAARADALEPVQWEFPFVGRVPYKGWFDRDAADAEAASLAEQGFDVRVSRVAAYSTLGWFTDPVFTSMLDLQPYSLAALILHEAMHATVYSPGNTSFNENVATFVERAGTLALLADRDARRLLPEGSRERAERAFATADWFNGLAAELRDQLEAYYRDAQEQGLAREQILAGREPVFGAFRQAIAARRETHPELSSAYDRYARPTTPINNAVVLSIARYELHQPLFEATFEHVGGAWPTAIALWREAAALRNPLDHIREVVGMESSDPDSGDNGDDDNGDDGSGTE